MQRLQKAYIWLDYICVPQPGATDNDDDSDESMPCNLSLKRQTTADSRLNSDLNASQKQANLAELCAKAVDSIPAYIELSTISVVFAPNTPHADRPEEQGATVCTVASWRGRGWCRTEFIGGLLAPRPKYYSVPLVR